MIKLQVNHRDEVHSNVSTCASLHMPCFTTLPLRIPLHLNLGQGSHARSARLHPIAFQSSRKLAKSKTRHQPWVYPHLLSAALYSNKPTPGRIHEKKLTRLVVNLLGKKVKTLTYHEGIHNSCSVKRPVDHHNFG